MSNINELLSQLLNKDAKPAEDGTINGESPQTIESNYQDVATKLGPPSGTYDDMIKRLTAPQQDSVANINKTREIPITSNDTINSSNNSSPKETKDNAVDQELQDAIAKRNKNNLVTNLLDAGNQIGRSISGSKYNPEEFKNLKDQASLPLTDLQTARKLQDDTIKRQMSQEQLSGIKEKADPNSDVSKLYRDALSKMGMSVSDTASAASLEKAFPMLERLDSHRNASEDRKLKYAQLSTDRESKASDKKDMNYRKLGEKVASLEASGRGSIGKAAESERRAGALKALATQYANMDSLTHQQVSELSRALDGVITGGVATLGGSRDLFPETYSSKFQEFKQKLSNSPTGAKLGKFVQQMIDTADRETEQAKKYRLLQSAKLLKASKKTLSDEDYETGKDVYGDYDALTSSTKEQHSNDDKEAIDWAKEHKEDPRAQKILKMHGL